MAVFVVDHHHQPLMPCSEKRARLLLARRRAVVHRLAPLAIRLTDHTRSQSTVQEVALRLDPGSRTTGVALVRVEEREAGEVHHALLLANLSHRGEHVRQALQRRAGYRRRRRTANLRHRPARFQHRRRAEKWLPPSLRSPLGNVFTWAGRWLRSGPVNPIEMESVTIHTTTPQKPEGARVEYQRGELFRWEIRA